MQINSITNTMGFTQKLKLTDNTNFQYISKNDNHSDIFRQNNNITFGIYKNVAKIKPESIYLQQGIARIRNHFSGLKNVNPDEFEKITVAEKFILNCVSKACAVKKKIDFSWEKATLGNKLRDYNYCLSDGSFFGGNKEFVCGSGEELYKFAKYGEDIDTKIRQLRETNPSLYETAYNKGLAHFYLKITDKLFNILDSEKYISWLNDSEGVRFENIFPKRSQNIDAIIKEL